ncbi:MAG: hypothetical protein COS85_05860 [Armatimonadetes bacterium CG07_land_8_20_14_0_80_59_28]|nr:MAG: hypothetical protein COS85_05860 [Armatimonadetes bacterium CG07_land_8_20_14_0_80_59_28]PIY37381.1 MAG: hypothetical protein COZ05_22480 [Armatimonadetes bacterium CG_4_10_14_3_um_filter_59_10]
MAAVEIGLRQIVARHQSCVVEGENTHLLKLGHDAEMSIAQQTHKAMHPFPSIHHVDQQCLDAAELCRPAMQPRSRAGNGAEESNRQNVAQ